VRPLRHPLRQTLSPSAAFLPFSIAMESAVGEPAVEEEIQPVVMETQEPATAAPLPQSTVLVATSGRKWGTSWSPQFPTERQLCVEAEALIRSREKQRGAPLHDRVFRSVSVPRWRERPGVRVVSRSRPSAESQSSGIEEPMLSYMTSGTSASSGAPYGFEGESTTSSQTGKTGQTGQKTLPPRRAVPVGRRTRHDPAKVMGEDGRYRLRGVQSTSDIQRFTKDVDPYSRKNWEIREAYKTMRSGQHVAKANQAWEALHAWRASEKPLGDWCASVKDARSTVG